jgi:hypothetical protein
MINKIRDFFSSIFNRERRRSQRFGPAHTIKCDCTYKDSGRTVELLAEVSNVSDGGLLILTFQEKVYPGTRLEITFEIVPGAGITKLHGTVLRCYRTGDTIGHYAAIKFDDDHEKGIQELVEYCHHDK